MEEAGSVLLTRFQGVGIIVIVSLTQSQSPITCVVASVACSLNYTVCNEREQQSLVMISPLSCRPYKDPNFDLRKMEQSFGVQAVQQQVDLAVQVRALVASGKLLAGSRAGGPWKDKNSSNR